jgi:hypothetical protein
MQNTRIYLLYNNEKIDEYLSDPRIFPLKLEPQGKFFESEAFRMLNMSDIPSEIDYIGFTTPSFFRKSGKRLGDIVVPKSPFSITSCSNMIRSDKSYMHLAMEYHGDTFKTIWDWLISELGYNPVNIHYGSIHIYCNMWVLSRDTFNIFLPIAKKAVKLLDNAPPSIDKLLFMDSTYDGRLSKDKLIELCGVPYYPYHPFIMERLICFVCDRYNWNVQTI